MNASKLEPGVTQWFDEYEDLPLHSPKEQL